MASNAAADTDEHRARDAVFATSELLENICKYLDVKTLLLAQRVDTQWRNCIRRSTNLQKKLFFQPATLDEMLELQALEDPPAKHYYVANNDLHGYGILNPLICWTYVEFQDREIWFQPRGLVTTGSWQRMLFLQPPRHSLDLDVSVFDGRDYQLVQRSGLQTMGEIQKEAHDVADYFYDTLATWELTIVLIPGTTMSAAKFYEILETADSGESDYDNDGDASSQQSIESQ